MAPSEAKAPWEQKWEKALAGAKKEGKVSIYTLWRPPVREAVSKAFKDKYGIIVDLVAFGRGAEMMAKIQAEQRAGLFIADVLGTGAGTFMGMLKPAGLLGPIQPLLILPEVVKPDHWIGGKLPFMDEDGLSFAMLGIVRRHIAYNADFIQEGEITSLKDLLKPKYKGKIIVNVPTVTGGGNALMTHLAYNLWGEEKTAEFFKQLMKEPFYP